MRNRIFFWVLMGALAIGVPGGLLYVGGMMFLAPAAGVVSVTVGLIYCGVVLWLMSHSTLWPGWGWWILAALGWGGGVAVVYQLPVTEITDKLGWEVTSFSFGGAYPEELIKGVGAIVILFSFAALSRPWHGLIAGFVVGLGFEVMENTMYGIMGAALDPNSDMHGVVQMWGLRMLAGPLIHACLTGIVGWGVGLAVFAAEKPRAWRAGVVLVAWFVAFSFHFLWNLSLPSDVLQLIAYVVVGLALYSTLVVCWMTAAAARRSNTSLLAAGG